MTCSAVQPVHFHVAVINGAHAPLFRGPCIVVQEGKLAGERIRVGAFNGGAAQHDVDLVAQHIGPDAVPEQFDGFLVAIGFEHAGPAELHEALARIGVDQRLNVVFGCGVEAAMTVRDFLPQDPVGADDLGFQAAELVAFQRGMIDDQEMIAIGVERICASRRVASVWASAIADISS